jgi:hypothetical protein
MTDTSPNKRQSTPDVAHATKRVKIADTVREEEQLYSFDSASVPDDPKDESLSANISPSTDAPASETRYIIVHRVECTSHHGHKPSMYHDCPKLYANDNKMTALHGKQPMKRVLSATQYAESYPDLSFVVERTYQCGDYHAKLLENNAFKLIPIPPGASNALAEFRAHLSILIEEGPEAEAKTEVIHMVGSTLKATMGVVRNLYPMKFGETGEKVLDILIAPYIAIFRTKTILQHIVNNNSDEWSEKQRSAIACLMKFVRSSSVAGFEEAEAMFALGTVSLRHFNKLFTPGDIVVHNSKEGPMGYFVSEAQHESRLRARLSCWSWQFDGKFFKKKVTWAVDWPSGDSDISISSLKLYPLQYDTSGVKERMRARGNIFWACKKKCLIEFVGPNIGFEGRPVSPTPKSIEGIL